MTDEELAAIRDRLTAATPGPWGFAWGQRGGDEGDWREIYACDDQRLVIGTTGYETGGVARQEDAIFVRHAPEDMAVLLAEVERLRARDAALWAIAQVVADAQVVATHPHFGETTYRVTDDGRLQERARTLLAKEPQP